MRTSPDELRRRQIEVLGNDLGATYHALENEYLWVRLKWQEFVVLFGSREQTDVLDAVAPAYFLMLQDVLSDDILMHLARLTDSPRTRGKRNLTVRALPELLDEGDAKVVQLVEAAVENARFARDWRNRRLAHRDLDLAIGDSPQPLEPARRDAFDTAIDSLHAVFSYFSAEYFGEHLDSEVVEAPGSALSLLQVLDRSLA